jgi:nucleotide-binding universal stress UspA family protein
VKALVCVDGRDWEAVVHGVARYLSGEGEVTMAHVVDERAPRGYEMSLRGLLGRRRPISAEERMSRASQEAAEGLLADAEDLLQRLRPGTVVEVAVLDGDPNHELMRAADKTGAQTIFIGRGTPSAQPRETVSGVVAGWNRNRKGEFDGLLLEDGTEVRFPPHRGEAIRAAICEGTRVEASGVWQGRNVLHSYQITDTQTGAPLETHETPDNQPGDRPLGHTARFVVDHALCDVVVLAL